MVAADVIKRYRSLLGKSTLLLSGTDEHGTKIANAAEALGEQTQTYVERMRQHYRNVLDAYDVLVDIDVHTAVDDHKRKVKQTFDYLLDKGDIYEGIHKGYFSPTEETYYTEFQIINGKSPQGFDVYPVAEKAYFFRLSKYKNELRRLISEDGFIVPKERQNEALGLLTRTLPDIAITRSNTSWGVPVGQPGFEGHTIYVWLDALLGYAIDYKQHDIGDDVLMVFGKDILRFIALVWPALLMSLDLPLPQKLICHGWLMNNDEKISKSKGEKLFALPAIGISDISRFVLMNLGAFGEDIQFNHKRIEDLKNLVKDKYANLTYRLTGMIDKRGIGQIEHNTSERIDPFVENIVNKWEELQQIMEQYRLDKYIFDVNEIAAEINSYITQNQLWEIQDESEFQRHVLAVCQALLVLSTYFYPIMPQLAQMNLERLQPHINGIAVKIGTASDVIQSLGRVDFKPEHLCPLI
ncbi:methionyl-tRNA synthetase [Babesia ovis]|uniref:methionine--tRNA ligase n=1 Tax=Babesia ovis TaxID=5869 RepID=A0A9W5TBV1_BABOV|nr:methionyl-tRNA synthetase [Babesia ovis]